MSFLESQAERARPRARGAKDLGDRFIAEMRRTVRAAILDNAEPQADGSVRIEWRGSDRQPRNSANVAFLRQVPFSAEYGQSYVGRKKRR
jgi:hypothetical protein